MSARVSLSKRFRLALSSLALLNFGCDDALKSASSIEETRPLGARVEVAGDPPQSSPAPGEAGHFRLFVAAPNGAPNVAYAFSLCGVSPTSSGFPSCNSAPFATVLQAEPTTAEPALDFEVPGDSDLSATPHGFVSGILCPDSSAEPSAASGAQCATGLGTAIAFEFDLAGTGEDNTNPTLTADSLTLDGSTWPASDPGAGCDSLPKVAPSTSHRLGVQLQDSDFDSLVQRTTEDPTRETLLVSQFSSAGKLAHTFASLTPDTPGLTSEVSWDAPASADETGTVVHFYFVVRDSRGGEDFAPRALCVGP